jgi:hypothetical protein
MMNTETERARAFNRWAEEAGWPAVCDPSLTFEAPSLRKILRIWQDTAKGGALPQRSQFTARLLKPHLGDIAIIERKGDTAEQYRFRLFGTRLAEALGELQGKTFAQVMTPNVVEHWRTRFNLTVAEGHPLRFVSRVDLQKKNFLRSESLWMPLADDNGATITLMSAVLTFNGRDTVPIGVQILKTV